jgi:hypothetical protein
VKVVLGTIAFVVIVDFLCLTTKNREQRLALIGSLAARLAALVALPGVLVLLLALLQAKDYTLGTAGMYAFWAAALFGWSRLVRWSCEFPGAGNRSACLGECRRRTLPRAPQLNCGSDGPRPSAGGPLRPRRRRTKPSVRRAPAPRPSGSSHHPSQRHTLPDIWRLDTSCVPTVGRRDPHWNRGSGTPPESHGLGSSDSACMEWVVAGT